MTASRLLRAALVPCLFASGCACMSNTEKGAATGGILGFGTGAIIGQATGHPLLGALLGTTLGTVGGAAVGNHIDRREQRQAAMAAANAPPRLSLTDIAGMAQSHISDTLIINQIRTTGSVYRLGAEHIQWLKASGVSDAVVAEMQATATRPAQRVFSPTPVYGPPPVYVVQPAPPPVSFGVGFSTRIH